MDLVKSNGVLDLKTLAGMFLFFFKKLLTGPTTVEAAKQEAPQSIAAKFGQGGFKNAFYAASSFDAAQAVILFHFFFKKN